MEGSTAIHKYLYIASQLILMRPRCASSLASQSCTTLIPYNWAQSFQLYWTCWMLGWKLTGGFVNFFCLLQSNGICLQFILSCSRAFVSAVLEYRLCVSLLIGSYNYYSRVFVDSLLTTSQADKCVHLDYLAFPFQTLAQRLKSFFRWTTVPSFIAMNVMPTDSMSASRTSG